MIIGQGMIARALMENDSDDTIFFCSGVSNSNEENDDAFRREMNILTALSNTDKKLIYFSSYFVNFESYMTKKYYQHKAEIEQTIQKTFANFTIYRLPQVVGKSTNPHTLTNFIAYKISNGESLSIYRGAKRNLIDLDDVVKIVSYANNHNLFTNQTVNLISPVNYDVNEIVHSFEEILQKRTVKHDLVSDEAEFTVLLSEEVQMLYAQLNIEFNKDYLINLISKYYKRG